MILAFRNWPHKRNRDLEAVFAELKRAAGLELVNGLRRSERGNNAFSLVKSWPAVARTMPEGRNAIERREYFWIVGTDATGHDAHDAAPQDCRK